MSTGKRLAFERIKAAVDAQGYFNTFDFYNGQFDTEPDGKIDPFPEPALFVEFGDIRWESRPRKAQHGEGVITFHVGRKWRKQEPGRIFEMEEKVTKLFHGFEDDHLSLERIDERQDTSMTHWARWSVNYQAAFKDEIAIPSTILAQSSPEPSISIDLVNEI